MAIICVIRLMQLKFSSFGPFQELLFSPLKSHGHNPVKQACSTRDEIEAPASLEFIALYVVRCHGIIEQFFYLSKHSYRKLDFQRFGNTLEQFEAPFP